MNKFKKFLSLSVLGAAALSMTAGACFLIQPTSSTNVAADVVENSISNDLPAFIKTDGLTKNSTYFTKNIPIIFDAKTVRTAQTTTTNYLFGYIPNKLEENHYYLFSDIQISITIDGEPIDSAFDYNKYIITSSERIEGMADVYPQVVAMEIARGSTFSQTEAAHTPATTDESGNTTAEKFTPGVLTLNKSGLLEVTISYTLYDTTRIDGKDETFTEETQTSTNQSFTYSAFLFNSDEYFETGSQNAPSIKYSTSFTRQASQSNSTHKWEYFYNYETKELPSITYNTNHVRLTITKNYNNSTESATLEYNPDTLEITKPSFVYDVVTAENSATIYFNDVGVYNLHFDLIYSYYQSDKDTYRTLEIEQPINIGLDGLGDTTKVLDQKVHLLGAQLSYTDYTNNQFKEFKKIAASRDEVTGAITGYSVEKAADVSHLMNSEDFNTWKAKNENKEKTLKDYIIENNLLNGLTPVSTNQTPLKLTANLDSTAGSYTLYKLNNNTWDKQKNFTLSKNISETGTYLLTLDSFGYAGYTASNKTFSQFFYFTINKITPDVEIKTETGRTLYYGEYTNEEVTITYNANQNDFDAPVRFELIRYDFNSKTTYNMGDITFGEEDNSYHITGSNRDGRYTLNIYYGKQSLALTPIPRQFTIDTQDISNLVPYAMETSGINDDYKKTGAFSQATNQPFAFTWQNEKASGAATYGYYKYYPLTSTNYYSSASNTSNLIANLLRNEILATDSELKFDTNNTWINYANPAHLIQNDLPISSTYIKESAGLYIFQIFDEAGNSAVQIVLLDDSKPYFVLDTTSLDGGEYSLITSHYTLTTDANLIWSKNKAIKTNYESSLLENISKNRNNAADDKINNAFKSFLSNNIKTYNDLSYNKNGNYYITPINTQIAYSDRTSDTYSIETMSQKNIQFSYTIHYTLEGGKTTYYISTSNSAQYLTMSTNENGEREAVGANKLNEKIYIGENELFTADIYMVSGTKEYYYGQSGSLSLTSLSGGSATLSRNADGKYFIGDKIALKSSFVDMEGTYVFLIRDASNTQGPNLSTDQKYLRYASNYQYIKVSGDSSQMSVYFEDGDENVFLTDASFSKIESLDESESDDNKNKKSGYFNPTSVEKILYISFIPTTGKEGSGEKTQVEKVTLAYYPFETQSITKLDTKNNLNIASYRTLAASPIFETELYSFETDGPSESAIAKEINIDTSMTKAGRYVLTRTYKTGDGYTIDVFDYYERSLTALVDRYGVITSPETIGSTATQKGYTLLADGTSETITATKYGNLIVVEDTSGYLDDNNCNFENTDATLEKSHQSGSNIYFLFDREVSDSFTLVSKDASIKIEANDSTDLNFQSSVSSLESIVGGDIFINMYDGEAGENVISVSFPYYKENGLNSGDTLYTSNNTNWADDANATTSLKTNKLPVRLYIPQVKYTMFNEELWADDGSNDTYFSNTLNDSLTYFDTDDSYKSTSVITPYQLVASVVFTPSGETTTHTYTSVTGKNGFLGFVDDNGAAIETFYKSGTYTVTITQGNYSDSNSSNNFRKNYKFGFVIESSAPEFNISASGKELKSLDERNYYTNEKTATISWEEDADDRYIAKIDKAKINVVITKSQSEHGETISIIKNDAGFAIESTLSGSNTAEALAFSQSGKMNYLTVDFEKLGIYNNNDKFSITMQFEGHNSKYYETTTKTIVIDKKASNEKIGELISKLTPLSNNAIPLTDTNLRDFYNIEGSKVDTADEAAYSVSKSVGYLKYYAYQVDNSFFTSLKTMVTTNNSLGANYRGETIAVYYRILLNELGENYSPYTSEFTETSYDNFTEANFDEISNFSEDYLGYVEIIEQDLAGNLTIYLVHKYSISSQIADEEADNQGLVFSDGTKTKQICDEQILSNMLNLYSSTNFSLKSLNFMGDRWLEVNINGELFMLSPWLETTQAYRLSGSKTEIVSLNSVFSTFSSKTTPINISISNSAQGNFASLKLTLLDGAQLNTYLSEKTSEEYISISYSSSVFPVKVIVYNDSQVYNSENDPNALQNLVSGYNYISSWTSNDIITATADQTMSRLYFAFTTLPTPNSKIKYEITDNFGNVTKIVHIYGQSLYKEVDSSGALYTNLVNDETTDHEAQTYYISPVDLRFAYNDTVHTVKIFKWDGNQWGNCEDHTSSRVNLTTLTFKNNNGGFINNKYKIVVYEKDDNGNEVTEEDYVKTIYFHLYNTLPQMDEAAESYFKLSDNYGENITATTLTDVSVQRITINGRVYTITRAGSTFASSVTFTFTNPESFDYPFSIGYYKENESGFTYYPLQSGTTFNESGVYYFLMAYNSVLTNEYRLYKLEILDSATEFYRVTNNGKQVQKAGSYYYYRGTEYSEYYIVNVNYNTSASLIQIIPNNYQNITVENTSIKVAEGEGVFTIGYRVSNYTEGETIKPGISPFDRNVFITYIPPTSQPVSEAYYTFNTADQTDILTSSSIIAPVDKIDRTIDSIKLVFSNSYGIANNLIQISMLKDGVPYPVEIKTEEISSESGASSKKLRYVELNTSGTYTISLQDIAGNQQVFAAGTSQASQTLKLIFLKDVAFTMTYTDANGITHTTDPIQKGVFNRKVDLTLTNTAEYYTAQSVGSGQSMITATRNGVAFTDFSFNADTKTFTFDKPGYYNVYFSATSTTGIAIREEVYAFTIVNPEESRYSFEYAPYNGYYITSIVKDNLGDITRNSDGSLKQEFRDAYQTVVIGNIEYLKNITTSFLDSLTGIGRYTITINTSKPLNRTDYTTETEFSFNYWINTKTVPISVSITEGEATSKNISISFNAERVFESVGECVVVIGANRYNVNADTISSLGIVNDTISSTGTYFITVRSTSGNLLYSYKVIKNEPLNTWAIIAICIGGVAAIAIIVIIVKLRKKIKVK